MRKLVLFSFLISMLISIQAYAQYEYDVSGTSDEGDVSGNVETEGKYVEGTITNEDGEEKDFDGEFTGYGTIEGYDEDGNYVELEVE